MIEYIYFVKRPNCEDEHFDAFDSAMAFACSCLSKSPIITQVEVDRNDFGECVDSRDLGTIWSWEEMMQDVATEPEGEGFSKKDTLGCVGPDCHYDVDNDPEFSNPEGVLEVTPQLHEDNIMTQGMQDMKGLTTDPVDKTGNPKDKNLMYRPAGKLTTRDFVDTWKVVQARVPSNIVADGFASEEEAANYIRDNGGDDDLKLVKNEAFTGKPIPEGMTVEDLVEEMERNENDVECTWCEELFDKSECRYEVDLGWLCGNCEAAIKSRGETLTFRENFDGDLSGCVASSNMEIWGVEPEDESTYRAVLLKRYENVSLQGLSGQQAVTDDMYKIGGCFAFMFDKDGNPVLNSWNVNQLNKLGHCEILFDDSRYDAALETQFNKKSNTATEAAEPVSHLETLEEAAEYRDRLILCDSCMTPSLDEETGICINCGASVVKEAALTEGYPSWLADEQKSLLESFIAEAITECEQARTAGQYNVHQVVMPWELRDTACKHCLIESLEKAGFPGCQAVNYDDELVFVPLNDKGQGYGKTMERHYTSN